MPQVNLSLRQEELDQLDRLADWLRKGRTETVRHLLYLGREHYGLRLIDAGDWLEELKANLGADAILDVKLDDQFDPYVSVDGERRDDLYVHVLSCEMAGDRMYASGQGYVAGGALSFFRVYLANHPGGDLQFLLGVLPLNSADTLRVPVWRLNSNMLIGPDGSVQG